MPGSRRPGVYVAVLGSELEQDQLDPRDRLRLTAGHETGTVPGSIDAAARPEVCELDALLLEPVVASNRVAPIGVSAVYENVAFVELGGEVVEYFIDRRARWDVDEDRPRRSEFRLEILVGADLDEPGLDHIWRGPVAREADHAYALLQGLAGEVASHPAQTHHAVLVLGFCHRVSSYSLVLYLLLALKIQ